jgi:pre-mRNA-processing factor 6
MSYQYKTLAVSDFLSREAPTNYIAGLGRGAVGFTTRGDIGPIDEQEDSKPNQFADPDSETALFRNAVYEKDDEEADRIWDLIESKMDERRKTRREESERKQEEEYRKLKPKVQAQFADLKRGLEEVTKEEWTNLPEVGDLTRKPGKKMKNNVDRYSAVPDSVILSAMSAGIYD